MDKSSNLCGRRTDERMVKACVELEEGNPHETDNEWGKVSAVFNIDKVRAV